MAEKEEVIRFRCTKEFKKQIEYLAKSDKRTISNYIETVLQEKYDEQKAKKE